MKIVLDIPQDFENHFNEDRFKDSLKRIKADLNEDFVLTGNYERELLDMLVVAFEEAEVLHSTCKLEGIPIYEMDYDTFGTQLMMKEMDEINVVD